MDRKTQWQKNERKNPSTLVGKWKKIEWQNERKGKKREKERLEKSTTTEVDQTTSRSKEKRRPTPNKLRSYRDSTLPEEPNQWHCCWVISFEAGIARGTLNLNIGSEGECHCLFAVVWCGSASFACLYDMSGVRTCDRLPIEMLSSSDVFVVES